jgi:predicted RecB family endonuclease
VEGLFVMTTLLIELPDERVQQLQRRATDLGISVADLVVVGIDDVLARPTDELKRTITYVLKKNAALYERLA